MTGNVTAEQYDWDFIVLAGFLFVVVPLGGVAVFVWDVLTGDSSASNDGEGHYEPFSGSSARQERAAFSAARRSQPWKGEWSPASQASRSPGALRSQSGGSRT